jgi:hypothetical protein
MADRQMQQETEELIVNLNKIITDKTALNDNVEKASSWLFSISAALGFVAIFSKFWIGGVAVVLALIACALLVYKSSIKLIDQMDINFWFLERCTKLTRHYDATVKTEKIYSTSQEYVLEIANCWSELYSIKADRKAYREGSYTDSLQGYYDNKYIRSRHSAKLKNKYNKHEIKDLGS